MRPGPYFYATYSGECSWGDSIEEDDRIRADGDGGWEHEECVQMHAPDEDRPRTKADEVRDFFG